MESEGLIEQSPKTYQVVKTNTSEVTQASDYGSQSPIREKCSLE